MVEVTKGLIDTDNSEEEESTLEVSEGFFDNINADPLYLDPPEGEEVEVEGEYDFGSSDVVGALILDELTNVSPEQLAKDREYAKAAGLPTAAVDLERDEIAKLYEKQQMAILGKGAPTTAALAKEDTDFAAIVKAEKERVAKAEWYARATGMVASNILQIPGMTLEGFGDIYDETAKGLRTAITLSIQAFDKDFAIAVHNFLTDPVLPDWANPSHTFLDAPGGVIRKGAKSLRPEDPNFVEDVLGGVSQAAAQMTVILLNPQLGVASLYSQGVTIVSDILKETGKEDAEWAGLAKVLGGSVTAVTEKYGLDLLFRKIPAAIRNRMVRILLGAGSEASQEMLEKIGHNLIVAGLVDPNRKIWQTGDEYEGYVAGTVGGIISALLPGRGRSVRMKKTMDKANQTYLESNVERLAPDLSAKHRQAILEDSGIESVQVDPEAFLRYANLQENTQQFLRDAGVSLNNIVQAQEAGEKLSIPMKTFSANIFGTEHYDALSDDLSYNLFQSNAEAKAELEDNIDDLINAAKEDQTADTTLRQRTLAFLEDFKAGKDIDVETLIERQTTEVLTFVDELVAQVKDRKAETETVINKGRISVIENQLATISKEIETLSQTIEEREAEGKPNVANNKKLDKLVEQQSTLEEELDTIQVEEETSGEVSTTVLTEEEIEAETNRRTVEDRIPALTEVIFDQGGSSSSRQIDGQWVRITYEYLVDSVSENLDVPKDIRDRLIDIPDMIAQLGITGKADTATRFEALRRSLNMYVEQNPNADIDVKELARRLNNLDIEAILKQERQDVEFVGKLVKEYSTEKLETEIELVEKIIEEDSLQDEGFNRVQEFALKAMKKELDLRQNGKEPAVAGNKKIETKAQKLRALNVQATRDTAVEVRKAFRQAKKLVKQDYKEAQKILTTLVQNSSLSKENQAKFIATIANMDSTEKLQKQLPVIQARINNMVDRQRKAQVKGAITKLAKKALKKPASGKKATKTNPHVDEIMTKVHEIMSLKKDEAADRLKYLDMLEGTEDNPHKSVDASPTAAIEGALLGLKADPDLVEAKDLEDILLDLTDLVEQGKAINKANKLWKAVQVSEMRMRVLDAMGPVPIEGTSTKKLQRKNTINKLWLSWNGAWRNKLQHIFRDPDGKKIGKLLDELSLFEESRAHDKGRKESMEQFNEDVKNRTGMTDRQILRQFQKDMMEEVVLGPFTMSDGSQRTIRMSRSELRKRAMEMMNDDLRTLAMDPDTEAYTEEVIDAINNEVSNTFDQAVIRSQLDFYNNYYTRINAVYRKMYGVNLPKVENYVPIKRDFGDGKGANQDEFLRSILYRGGAVPGSLKSRQPSKMRLKQAGDVETLVSHVTEMEYFIAYAEKVALLNSVFGGDNNVVMNRITDEFGTAAAATIKADLGYFSNRGVISSITGEDIIVRLMRNFGFAQLGAKPQIGLKQLASFSAFAQEVGPAQFAKHVAGFGPNFRSAMKLLNKSDFYANRGMNLDIDFQDLQKDAVSGRFTNFMGRHPNFTRVMMLPIRYGDKAAIAVGGYAYIKSKMEQGFTEQQAIEAFGRLANRTQQSADPDQLSEIQRGTGFGRILGQFMSSANAITRAEIEAFGEWKKGRISNAEMAKRFVIYHMLVPNFIMIVANGFNFDAEDHLKASLLGSFSGLIVLGDVIEILASVVMGDEDPFDIQGRHPFELFNALKDFASTINSDDFEYDYVEDQIKALEHLLDFGAGATGIPMATLFRELKGAGMMLDKDERSDGTKLLLGYSPYIIEKNKE